MKAAIGFANKFYTLWDIDVQPSYTTDSYGKHWLTGYDTHYYYVKNISIDLDKVKTLYPDVTIDENLRGKSNSWMDKNKEDLCPQIMKFGKYSGYDLNELVITDFNYVLWLVDNSRHSSNGKYAFALPQVTEHYLAVKAKEEAEIKAFEDAFAAVLAKGVITFDAERNLSINDNGAYLRPEIDGVHISFEFSPEQFSRQYYQDFEYGLPLVKGKAKRIKGKSVTIEFTKSESEDPYTVKVVNFVINKTEPVNN